MLPRYDFDIQWLIPREVEADPAIGKLLSDIGFNGKSRGNYIALFRDPQVITMIEQADPMLREYLKASGFGFIPYQSGAPAGYFPAVDQPARTDVITRLDENLERFDLKDADMAGFDFAAFVETALKGEPLSATETESDATRPREAPAQDSPDPLATPTAFAKFSGRNRVMPFMVLALAVTLGTYWLIQHIEAAPIDF